MCIFRSAATLAYISLNSLGWPDGTKKAQLLTLCEGLETEDTNCTDIHNAILGNNYLALEEALRLFPQDLNSVDFTGLAPLHWAALRGDLIAVQTLLKSGANVNQLSSLEQSTPLHQAAASSFLQIFEELIFAGAIVNKTDFLGRTPLFDACTYLSTNTHPIVQLLLANGANPNIRDFAGQNPLHILGISMSARQDGNDLAVVGGLLETLVTNGADMEARDVYGHTPLHYSCFFARNMVCFKTLVALGANVSATDVIGVSILHITSLYGNLE